MIRHIPVSISSAGDSTLVSSEAGLPIRVREWLLVAGTPTTVTFLSGSTPLTGPLTLVAGGGVQQSERAGGHFVTSPGESLVLRSSVAAVVGGHLVIEIG